MSMDCVGFHVLTVWIMTLGSLTVSYWSVRGACCLCLQCGNWRKYFHPECLCPPNHPDYI